jgi:hypothetical protein
MRILSTYCPECWNSLSKDVRICPHCGVDIPALWESKDWVEKLIVALRHPEPNTRLRATWLLGKLDDSRAVDALIDLVNTSQDIYLVGEAVLALGQTQNGKAVAFLAALAGRSKAPIGIGARRFLEQSKGTTS